jgi:4-amino-4-deoxy-L-arabinose transferase-like glycosyltransferase
MAKTPPALESAAVPRPKRTIEIILANLFFILLIAFVARCAFALHQSSKIPHDALAAVSFDQETGSIAASIATGKGFSSPFRKETGPTAWLTPVYPLLVAASFKLFGVRSLHAFYFLVFLNILFSTAVCAPLYWTSRRVAGIQVTSVAAWLWALFPNAIMVPFEWIWDTSLSALLAAMLLWATLEVPESSRWRDWCGYGLLWGLALMTNPALAALLPFLLLWSAYRAQKQAQLRLSASFQKPAAALALAILCCIPWTARNYQIFHRVIPFRSNFPFELYIGNNENYDDPPKFPPPITKDRETVRYIHMGEIPFMDEELRKAKLFMKSHPRKVFILFGDRFAAFWTGAPYALDAFRSTDSWLARAVLLCVTFSGIGALVGTVFLAWRRSPFTFPLATCPIVFPIVYYVTHTSLRYRHPVDPIVLLLAAIAISAAVRPRPKVFSAPDRRNAANPA